MQTSFQTRKRWSELPHLFLSLNRLTKNPKMFHMRRRLIWDIYALKYVHSECADIRNICNTSLAVQDSQQDAQCPAAAAPCAWQVLSLTKNLSQYEVQSTGIALDTPRVSKNTESRLRETFYLLGRIQIRKGRRGSSGDHRDTFKKRAVFGPVQNVVC